jgi:hypothetical protein
MTHKTLQIKASYEQQESQSGRISDPNILKNDLLSIGYEEILVDGALLDKFAGGFRLFVDDDVVHFMYFYLTLEEQFLSSSEFNHSAYLSDGEFSTVANFKGENVELIVKYCPALDSTNLIVYTEVLSVDQYVWWWRGIARRILDAALKR